MINLRVEIVINEVEQLFFNTNIVQVVGYIFYSLLVQIG